ncbi:MAG TPA: acyl-CoA synthetase [Acidimicrobiales bacterium]|nr:acyl-CoA synthetase [Acidimicrobiales bacterium]
MAYNIADLFEHTVDSVADREVLVIGDERRSYGQLEARANRLAHHLAAQGIGPGDHIGVYGSNSIEWIEAALAAYKVRAVPVNVNFRYVTDELRYLFDNADLKAVVYDRELAPRLAAVRDELPLLRHLIHIDDGSATDIDDALERLGSVPFEDAMASGSPERDFPGRSADDHYVLYTGGTTGMPKGVVWRHEDVFYSLGGGIDAYTNERVEDEWTLANKAKAVDAPLRSLNLPPLMHGAAQWGFLRFAFEGNLIVMLRRFDPHEVWRTIERERINSVSITGDAMARPMIEALDDLGGAEALDLSSMFVLASTAAIFSPTVKDRYLETFPNLLLIDAIGSSETGSNGMRTVGKGDTQNKGGGPTVQAGRDTVVLDEELREVEPGSGRQGRLARRGNVPIAYYKDEQKSAETFVIGASGDRYALAGDMAILEADCTITLLGRGSQCINSGGEKIFPEEVEAALKAHPSVFDAIVVGVPDDRWGQRVAAVIQPRPGLTPTLDELDAHCRSHVAAYKVPKEVHLVTEVVRSPSGKPDYPWAGKVARGEISA